MVDYKELSKYCKTETQSKYLRIVSEHSSIRAASKETGIPRSTLGEAVRKIKAYAAQKGYAPEHGMDKTVPEGFAIKGTSTLYDNEGNKVMQWVKSDQDKERQLELVKEAISLFKEDVATSPVIDRTSSMLNSELLNCYVLADYHMGMIAHELVNKDENWDTEKAEQVLYDWFTTAIASAPPAENCVFMELGDYMHIDNQSGTTERSGNILDHGVPMNILIRVAIRTMRKVVKLLAEKYNHVHVMIVDGNHNESGANWMQELLLMHYEDNDRITIDDNKTPFYCYEFGEVSLFAHHGHRKKLKDVEEVFIGEYRKVFGRTSKSYAHLGHRHHKHIESNNMIVEQHPTLAAKDMHASYEGYKSDRCANVITYHKKYGEVSRITISRDMV